MSEQRQVCGAVVIFAPDEDVVRNIAMMVAECGTVFVADNGSEPEMRARLMAVGGVEWIGMGGNRGVAAALNAAAERALQRGFTWLVTFDQDSLPRRGLVGALLETAARNPKARVVVPRIVEAGREGAVYRWVRPHTRWPAAYQRVAVGARDVGGITLAVTSGSLTHLATWKQLEGFDEALFIDYVDIDYCLKVRRGGGEIVVSAAAELEHQLGARRSRTVLGHDFRPTYHAPFRHYYMARNRVRTWKRHGTAVPHWAVFDFSYALYNCVRVLAFEPEKALRLRAMILGTWDGLRGRSGPCPPDRCAKLVGKSRA